MVELNHPVNIIKNIGPKYKQILNSLGIATIKDLIYYFPFRYDDFTNQKTINQITAGETVNITATIFKIQNIFTPNKKKLTKAILVDNTGQIEATWFNMHYLTKTLKPNTLYSFSGKAEKFGSKINLIAPKYEAINKTTNSTQGLVSIYSETLGITSNWLRDKIKTALQNLEPIQEYIPQQVIKNQNLLDINQALYQFHFPQNELQAKQAKKRLEFEELFIELLKVYHQKKLWHSTYKSHNYNNVENKQKLDQFIKNLPFTLTNDQLKAINEITQDFEKQNPMNRLLEGDVGTGKTLVAVAASYLTVINKLKVLYIAPTEILAQQHYNTFCKILEPYNIKILLKTGNTKKVELHTNDFDIAIGTHAIFYTKQNINNIGLVIIDEQHRFGVEQRAISLKLGNEYESDKIKPHLLSMTATPIPRTLALTIYGDLDISQLIETPNKDKTITTYVVTENKREQVFKLIKQKMEQTFIVCPFVEQSETEGLENIKAAQQEFIKLKEGYLKGVSIGLLHGKMKPEEKAQVIEDFKNKKIRVLVSTPVIEVGVDIPEATTIVIESAERYGLASLHQLRGRVGRGSQPGFCFIFSSSNSKYSIDRLKNLEKINNGLELAEIDLKIRGEGDIYGTMQSGFKNFKVASITNLAAVNNAKLEAEKIYPQIDLYPDLKQKITSLSTLIEKN